MNRWQQIEAEAALLFEGDGDYADPTPCSKVEAAETQPPQNGLVDIRRVAQMLGVSSKTVRRMTRRGQLPRAVRIGRQVRWKLADIERYIKRL